MTESNDMSGRVDKLDRDVFEIRLAASALLQTAEIHQRNFEVLTQHFESLTHQLERERQENQKRFTKLEETQQDIRGILNLLTQRLTGEQN